MRAWIVALSVIIAVLIGCKQPQRTVIAKVGDSELTMEEAKAEIDTSIEPLQHQLPRFVASWVNAEMLYQEARRRGIENRELFQQKLLEVQRQLAIESLLQQQVYNDLMSLGENELREYFDKHAAEFSVREDMIKLNLAIFTRRDLASSFAARITRGEAWDAVMNEFQRDSVIATNVVEIQPRRYYSQESLFPIEVWKVATALGTNEVSFPVSTTRGYAVVQKLSSVRAGDPAELEIVRDEVRARYIVEQRRLRYAELLGTLRKHYDVEVFMNIDPSQDTIQFSTHE